MLLQVKRLEATAKAPILSHFRQILDLYLIAINYILQSDFQGDDHGHLHHPSLWGSSQVDILPVQLPFISYLKHPSLVAARLILSCQI